VGGGGGKLASFSVICVGLWDKKKNSSGIGSLADPGFFILEHPGY
jgi:hypothetical protein